MKKFIITGLLILQASCAAKSPNYLEFNGSSDNTGLNTYRTANHTQGMENSGWRLSRFIDAAGQKRPVLSGAAISALFSNNQITGHSGCNRYFGNYQIAADQRLSLTIPMAATMMGCRPDINNQEQDYFNRLSKTAYYRLGDQSLTLLNQNSQPTLEFKPAITATLENTPWQTAGIAISQGNVTTGQSTHSATARFVNGQLSGTAGCNQYSAAYTLNGRQLSIGQIRTTQMACAEPEIMEQESRYLQVLTHVSQYQITDSQLKLFDSNGLVIVGFTAQKE